jgi:hypothetical protein
MKNIKMELNNQLTWKNLTSTKNKKISIQAVIPPANPYKIISGNFTF